MTYILHICDSYLPVQYNVEYHTDNYYLNQRNNLKSEMMALKTNAKILPIITITLNRLANLYDRIIPNGKRFYHSAQLHAPIITTAYKQDILVSHMK